MIATECTSQCKVKTVELVEKNLEVRIKKEFLCRRSNTISNQSEQCGKEI